MEDKKRKESGADGGTNLISAEKQRGNGEKGDRMWRYWLDYLADRRGVLFLFLLTCVIFVAVCALWQMHNFSRLLYAFVLAAFFWLCAGAADGRRYVEKRRKLTLARKNLEQVSLLFTQEDIGNEGTRLEEGYRELLYSLSREEIKMRSEEERQRSERNDYYLIWAHQIKTPIAAMKLLLEGRDDGLLLTRELFKVEQYAEMVLQYLRLESFSSDLLLREYDLYDMVRQTVKKFSVLFIGSRLKLQLEEFYIPVLTDEKWLCFVLEQLLSNSIKYTRTGGISIYPDSGSGESGSGGATLVIADTGIGIRAEDLPRIFERGFTGYNGRMDKKSTGLGLYLCRQVMNKLGHGLRVESSEGEGCRVYLELDREI